MLQNGTLLNEVRLASTTEQEEQVITVANFSSVQMNIMVAIKVTSTGKSATIDGLGVTGR